MRFVLLGVAALGIVSLAMWITRPADLLVSEQPPRIDTSEEFAQRIGLTGVQKAPALSISVSPVQPTEIAFGSSVPIRDESAAPISIWGAPAEFAPHDD